MGLNNTPRANRLHIGIFGRRNAGKSSLINALTGQDLAIVSDTPGTTADPVYKSMELHPVGPVVFIDTAGLLIVTFAVRSYLTYSLIRVFLYMMVPYLLAAFLGSLYERKKRTDAGLGSIVICLLSSAVFAAAPIFMSSLYEESLTIIWAAAFILLICCLAVSVREQMREMEEPVWN